MKVCVIGGSEFVPVANLVEFLEARGDRVEVVGFGQLEFPKGVRTHRLRLASKLGLFSARASVASLVRAMRPDVVHAFYLTSYGYLASAVDSAPVVATAMGSDVFGAPDLSRILQPLRNRLARVAIRRADRLHSVAEHMTARLLRLGADPSKIRTFPRGVETARFVGPRDPEPSDAPLGVVCTRKLEPVYDHETLLAGAARFVAGGGRLRLTIVGNGYLRPDLERRAQALGLEPHVRFDGEVSHEGMPAIYRESAVYASASLSDGTSSCLLEAMAAGCVPVTSDIEANRAWIEDGRNGFLFPAGDAAGLADALKRAEAARADWPRIAEANRGIVEARGSRASGMERIAAIYRELAG